MSGALDRFFGHYYGRRPVNATFTGVHNHDEHLPDWSINGLESLDDEMHALAQRVMYFSPEPSVIVKLIESAMLSGHDEEALAQAARFRASFPQEYARWIAGEPLVDVARP